MKQKDLDEKPSFYKIILPTFGFTEQVRIPPALIEHINERVFKKATLRDGSGRGWPVKMHKNEDGVFIKEGWNQFFHAHSLVLCDLLTFTYDGETCFHVCIFGKNGQERVFSARDASRESIYSDHCSDQNVPRLRSREIKQLGGMGSSKNNIKGRIVTRSPDIIKEKVYPSNRNKNVKAKASCTKQDGENRKRGQRPQSPELECPNVEIKEEIINVSEPGFQSKEFNLYSGKEAFNSRFPFFHKQLDLNNVTNPYRISFHRAFAKRFLPDRNTKMVLRNGTGKAWTVQFSSKVSSFYGGWCVFMRDNKLKPGDVCTFELVKETEMKASLSTCAHDNSFCWQIPPKIMDHIDECVFQKATLRDSSGRSWLVKLHKTENGVFVKEGWKQFFHAHSLALFEFLIFIYDGKTCFHVRIFGKNGLERVIPVRDHAPSGSEVSFEHCSEDENKSGTEEVCDFSPQARPFNEKRKSGRPIKKSKNSLLNLQAPLSPHTKAPGQDAAHLRLKKNNRQIICMGDTNERAKASSEKHDHGKRKRGRPPGSKNKNKGIIEVHDEPGTSFKKFNSCEMRDGIHTTMDACDPVCQSFEKYITVFDVKYQHKIRLPKAFSDSNLPNTHTKVVLRNEKGISWVVNFLPHRTCPQFGRGWVLFMRENMLKVGDHCKFKLVKENEMMVHISYCREH